MLSRPPPILEALIFSLMASCWREPFSLPAFPLCAGRRNVQSAQVFGAQNEYLICAKIKLIGQSQKRFGRHKYAGDQRRAPLLKRPSLRKAGATSFSD
jgi:hypothetical protein